MNISNNQSQLKAVLAALDKLHVQPFRSKSSNAKLDAQRNLDGKTHYVDEDTLRFHHSGVLSCEFLADGLLLRIVESDAIDMNNTKRGYRAVVFDVFGNVVDRPRLEECKSTKQAAFKVSDAQTIDLVAHYGNVMSRDLQHRKDAVAEMETALTLLAVS